MREAGGEVYAITSEPQRLADMAQQDWGLSFECLGDPHHEVIDSCRDKGWLDIIVNTNTELQQGMPSSKFSHPKGYFQPGVLAVNKQDRVLYRWRGVPTRKNLGGAVVRPMPEHVWSCMTQAFTSDGDAAHDDNPVMDSQEIPWPLFVTILTANGWFFTPEAVCASAWRAADSGATVAGWAAHPDVYRAVDTRVCAAAYTSGAAGTRLLGGVDYSRYSLDRPAVSERQARLNVPD